MTARNRDFGKTRLISSWVALAMITVLLSKPSALYSQGHGFADNDTTPLDKKKSILEEYLTSTISDSLNIKTAQTYEDLAFIYEQSGDSILAQNAFDMSQDVYVKTYIQRNPKELALAETYKMLSLSKRYYENNGKTNDIRYVNTLILLGDVLNKACGDNYIIPYRLYMKAFDVIKDNNLTNVNTPIIKSLFISLHEIAAKYLKEPLKTQLAESIKPYEKAIKQKTPGNTRQ